MKTALVITGGYCNITRTRRLLPDRADLIIAADSGYATAQKLGIKPDVVLGDFDSYGGTLPNGMETVCAPREKDDTDTMLACEYARERGCDCITIIGGTGGRIDHSLSNIFYLENLRRNGVRVRLTDGENSVSVLIDETVTVDDTGGYYSVLALDKCVVTEYGCKYPLERATLVRERPYAVSNEVVGGRATVTVEGAALLITSRKR